MTMLPKFFVNEALVFSEEQESQIVFLVKRPSLDSEGKPILIKEEQASVAMSFEYLKKLSAAIEDNIKKHEHSLIQKTQQIKEGEVDNG